MRLGRCFAAAVAQMSMWSSIVVGDFAILPPAFELHGRESIQRVIVVASGQQTKSTGNQLPEYGSLVQSDEMTLRSSDESVIRVEDEIVYPVGGGMANVEAWLAGHIVASATVRVDAMHLPHQWSFRNEVQSVLARQGCNMGACHGALAGKGGFRLSLRGYDADADYFTIAREVRGRRIEIADPGRSLLVAKPTGALPHKGGLRLDVNSRDYRVVSQWIADGAVGPSSDDARLTHLSVSPKQSRLRPGDQTRILVSAHYDDGRIVDVSHWAKFSATDEAVASVDDHGLVRVRGSGEAAVLVWFGSRVELARMTVPYDNAVPESVFAAAPKRNFIDEINLKHLQTLDLPPSPRVDDLAFLRRATIDTVGRLPTAAEQRRFSNELALGKPTRVVRDALIEQLLASESFVDYWAYRFSDLLLVNGTKLRPAAVEAYYKWIRSTVASGQPWDQTVHELLTATGISTENGATNFFALHQTPEEMTENASKAFLGLSIGCAKCHNHPLEKWTNDQYYAMANLFSRVRAKGWGGETRNGDGIRTLYVSQSGELIQPSTGKPQPPAPLDATPLAFDDPSDRRGPLAQWMTDPDNPYFARAITNRIWANFFGRGLVEPVDDLRLSNPASNEALLAATSEHLIHVGFDLRRLMRTILQSETYQRDSLPLPENAEEFKYFSRYYPRRLMAEVLLDCIDQTLQTHTRFDRIAFIGSDVQKTTLYPVGTRAIELYDAAIESYFLKTFGRNPREITCDCERSDEPSMVQVLHMSNGTTINEKVTSQDGLLARCLKQSVALEVVLRDLFERAICRSPEPDELDVLLQTMAEYGDDERTALGDVAWSILTSTEFTFNH